MESINSIRNRFIDIKKQAEAAILVKDFASAKMHLQKAVEILRDLYQRDTNPKNREDYVTAMNTLRAQHDRCLQELGEAKKVPLQATKRPVQQKPAGGKAEPGKPADDGITYEFNGIDVKNFLTQEARSKVTFSDVIGMEEEKRIVRQELFLTPEQMEYKKSLGLDPKNFILLYGLPGTGKTFFAMALSNELSAFSSSDIPFFSVLCTQLKGSLVGQTENNIIALFEFTKQFDRCVLFMDEFDAIGMSRTQASNDPTAIPTVNTLLTQLSGFSSNPNLLFLAATNCPYNLDGALLSRAALRIEVPLPSAAVLEALLKRKLGNKVDQSVDLASLARALEKGKYSNRDASNFIQAALSEVFNAHLADPSVNLIDVNMINLALSKAKSSIKANEEARLEAFKLQGI
ncbi:MAG: ATP-binding protein [Bacilli bacterium]|nr:ATP-binding protein [Bacilli bacterium]